MQRELLTDSTHAVTVVLGDGRGVELVELLLEAERACLLAHLAASGGGGGGRVCAARHAAREREAARRRRRRVGQVVEEDLRLARLAAKGLLVLGRNTTLHNLPPILFKCKALSAIRIRVYSIPTGNRRMV